MLYVSVSQHIVIVAVQHSPQHLPVYLVLTIDLSILLVDTKEFYHVKTCLGLVKRNSKNV